MGQVFAMGSPIKAATVTEGDPFVNVYDDGSVDAKRFNTMEEAIDDIPVNWRAGTKTMRVSELPKTK